MVKVSVVSFFCFIVSLGIYSSFVSAAGNEARVSHFTCQLDVGLTGNDASSSLVFGTTRSIDDLNQQSKPAASHVPKETLHRANLIGRGIANCKNEQGFQFNLPAVMAIAVTSPSEIPFQTLKATVQPISVERDVNRIFDTYDPHIILGNTPTISPSLASDRVVIVHGEKNDVLMQINLNVPGESTQKLKISQVDLKFDREAPTLK